MRLIDPVPLHVEQASSAGIEAAIGDARRLQEPAASFDVVLLLGPLYHLPDRRDRTSVLVNARRVLRPNGVLFAAGISRHAALLDLLINWDKLHHPGIFDLVEESVRTGEFRGPGEAGLFTTSYFHLPRELREEVMNAELADVRVFHVEGPGFLIRGGIDERLDDPARREALLKAIRLVEEDYDMLGSAHLLAVGRARELA